MSGPWEKYAAQKPSDGPWAKYAKRKPGKAEDVARSYPGGILGAAGALGDQIADAASRANPFVKPVLDILPRPHQLTDRFGGDYKPQTRAGRWAQTGGQMTLNALAPGSAPQRIAGVVLPTIGAEGAEEFARSQGYGERGQRIARTAGAVAGGVLASGVGRRRPESTERNALAKMQSQAPQQANALQARITERQAAGLQPTLADVVDESGRGVVRAAAGRMTPARAQAQEFADARANALPVRMGQQARTHLSPDPRTPREIGAEIAARRGASAARNYGAVRGDVIQMQPETVTALRTDFGREAIRMAAKGERDPNVKAALLRLSNDALDNPSTPITIGMADSISRALYGMAQDTRNNNLRGILTGLADDIRGPARAASPGYGAAVDDFAQESRLIGAAERGEDYLARDTDNFVAEIRDLGADGLPLARATARRAVERAAGENVSAAPGVARRIATAPEVQARTRALLPEEQAQAFERAMALEEEAVRNARNIAPLTGSQTQNKLQDAAGLAGDVVEAGGAIASGNPIATAIAGAKLFLRGQRLSNREAEALVNLAIDPARTQQAIQILSQRIGPQRAQAFMAVLQRAGVPALAAGAATSQTSATQ